jgi:hypothetical protein
MLDGYHWRPLDAELDYDLVAHRVLELHFADEMAQAAQMAMAANHTTVD